MKQTLFYTFYKDIADFMLKDGWTWTDFVIVQRLRCDIEVAHKTNWNSTEPSLISDGEYRLLNHMAEFLMGKMRAFLNGGEFK